MRDAKILALLISIYVVGAVIDDVTTYLFIVKWGIFSEANPFMRGFIRSVPMWLCIARDLGVVALLTMICLYIKKILETEARRRGDEQLMRVAGRWWIPLAVASGVRLIPAVHNVLLVLGIDTGLEKLYTIAIP